MVVREHPGAEPTAVLTGDSLFIGDVGRPDLVNIGDSSTTDLARAMYHSIHDKLLRCPTRSPSCRLTAPGRHAARTCRPS